MDDCTEATTSCEVPVVAAMGLDPTEVNCCIVVPVTGFTT